MYETHEHLFDLDDNCILWKYMSFSKFINLLSGKLYFSRVNYFEDVFEGTYPAYNAEHRDEVYANDNMTSLVDYNHIEWVTKKYLYVSCFHKNEYETAFMWKQYADTDGIAINTTVGSLKNAFNKTSKKIYITDVAYIDYNKDFMPEGNIFYLITHKRKSFEPESEVRCIYMRDFATKVDPENPTSKILDKEVETPRGEYIDIDLKTLIEKIYISPYAAPYIEKNLDIIKNKFDLTADVIPSMLLTLK